MLWKPRSFVTCAQFPISQWWCLTTLMEDTTSTADLPLASLKSLQRNFVINFFLKAMERATWEESPTKIQISRRMPFTYPLRWWRGTIMNLNRLREKLTDSKEWTMVTDNQLSMLSPELLLFLPIWNSKQWTRRENTSTISWRGPLSKSDLSLLRLSERDHTSTDSQTEFHLMILGSSSQLCTKTNGTHSVGTSSWVWTSTC